MKEDAVLVQLSANASDLHLACVRLATELTQLPEITDDPVHFDITSKGLEITIEDTSARLRAEVQNGGAVTIPFTVLAGVLHMLPYFGKNAVEIGFSHGKMRVNTTVFHNPSILLTRTRPKERRRPSFNSTL
jgi:hypothetical protein